MIFVLIFLCALSVLCGELVLVVAPNCTDFLRVPFVSSVVALVLVFGCGCAALCGWRKHSRMCPEPALERNER